MKNLKLENGKALENFLLKITNESVQLAKDSINEQEDDVFGADAEDEKLTPQKGELAKDRPEKKEEEPEKEKKTEPKRPVEIFPQSTQEVDTKMIIDKINSIRAGHSTDSMRNELEEYIGKLKREEKKVLASFLSSIGAIMSGNISGDEINTPEESLDVDIMTDEEFEDLTEPREKVKIEDEDEDVGQLAGDVPIHARPRFPPHKRRNAI